MQISDRKDKVRKPKRCHCGCGLPATGGNGVTVWASIDCAIRIAERRKRRSEARREREEIAEFRARKERAKRPQKLKAEAQAAFNAYIRARDLLAGHPCICCGRPFEPQKPGGAVDAGHYLSVGSAPHLRFDERNVHAQRKNCNRPGGATRAAFRAGMIDRIGIESVEALESDQTEKHYTSDDYRRIRDEYRAKLKALRAQEGYAWKTS